VADWGKVNWDGVDRGDVGLGRTERRKRSPMSFEKRGIGPKVPRPASRVEPRPPRFSLLEREPRAGL